MDDASPERPPKMRRMRKPVSCVECRIRKIKCDRNVPNCSACIRRGIRHHCRWGDERDEVDAARADAAAFSAESRRSARRQHDVTGLFPLPVFEEGATLPALFANDIEEWELTMETYLMLLPEPEEMDRIIAFYFRELEPLINCMHHDAFQRDYATLKAALPLDLWAAARQSGQASPTPNTPKTTRPAFWGDHASYGLLALLLAVLHASCESMDRNEAPKRATLPHCTTRAEYERALDNMHAASVSLLREAQCMERPTLWVLQTVILLQRRPYNALLLPVFIVWNTLAVRIAQLMGLNRLGSLTEDLARLYARGDSDPSAQSGVRPYMAWLREFAPNDLPRRELARKIWTTLVTTDWLRSVHIDLSYVVADDMNLTAPPAALTDEELARVTSVPAAVLQDTMRPSPHTYGRILLELARCVRQASRVLIRKMLHHDILMVDHPRMLEIDAQIGALVNSLPIYFRFDGIAEVSSSVQAIHAKYPYLTLQRLFLQEQIHFRILVLHAPYLQAAMRDPAHRRSLIACIEGACVVVTVWEELQRGAISNPQVHYVKWHLIIAAVVLDHIIASIHASGNTTPPSDYLRLRTSLRNAVQFLEDPKTQRMLQRLPQKIPLGHLRRFCATPEPEEAQEAGTTATTGAAPPAPPQSAAPPLSLVDEYSQLGDALPLMPPDATWQVDDQSFLANLDFLLTEGGGALSDSSTLDADFPFLGL
ncbi:hypothetical protein GLX27_003681 [Malassezia furfur]|uniref:Zn(2)-C6 fungal-type domain-containing protein n=1 Tax=Malassezia furfur TaxID=55194 RepID=A0ABY8EU14_MALFU|nr:hypothetical protein CBS14141_003295 [Malassezia furfur]WFD49004.1 hypothetical protein GLX27_003681 [Malassezia furfur]